MKSKEFYDFEYLKKNAWVQANELKARGVKEFDGIKMISSDFFLKIILILVFHYI